MNKPLAHTGTKKYENHTGKIVDYGEKTINEGTDEQKTVIDIIAEVDGAEAWKTFWVSDEPARYPHEDIKESNPTEAQDATYRLKLLGMTGGNPASLIGLGVRVSCYVYEGETRYKLYSLDGGASGPTRNKPSVSALSSGALSEADAGIGGKPDQQDGGADEDDENTPF